MRKNLDLRNAVREMINDPHLRKFARKEATGWGLAFRQFGSEMAGALGQFGNECVEMFDPYAKPK